MGRDEPPRGTVSGESASLGQCPACGGSLFPWVKAHAFDARRDEEYVLDRCERCGTGVARSSAVHPASGPRPDAAAEAEVGGLVAGSGAGRAKIRVPNRRSLQAAIGEGKWAALELPERPLQLTPAGLQAVLARLGVRAAAVRYPLFSRNQVWMWQTLLNALTFEANFAREVLAGRRRPEAGRRRATFVVDLIVSALAAPLVALFSVPLETVAALVRRGGELRVVIEPEAGVPQESSRTIAASSSEESS